MSSTPNLPLGVELRTLATHCDYRGTFTELFRQSWMTSAHMIQWNAVNSECRVLRGVHLHHRHADYLTVLRGRVLFGLKDLRPESATYALTALVEISEQQLTTLYIPPGVAHGFYFIEPSLHVYAVSEYWDMADELGCRYDDPDLGIPWPDPDPVVSDRDRDLPSLQALLALLHHHRIAEADAA
jgi:dTDP-4-dehydrorhamnose 3,5-epimerase